MSIQLGIRPYIWKKMKTSTKMAEKLYAQIMDALADETNEDSQAVMKTLLVFLQTSLEIERQCKSIAPTIETSREMAALGRSLDCYEEGQP